MWLFFELFYDLDIGLVYIVQWRELQVSWLSNTKAILFVNTELISLSSCLIGICCCLGWRWVSSQGMAPHSKQSCRVLCTAPCYRVRCFLHLLECQVFRSMLNVGWKNLLRGVEWWLLAVGFSFYFPLSTSKCSTMNNKTSFSSKLTHNDYFILNLVLLGALLKTPQGNLMEMSSSSFPLFLKFQVFKVS